MKYTLPCRKMGALGLPTVKLITDETDKALEFMLKMELEFMPCEVYASAPVVINLTDGDES